MFGCDTKEREYQDFMRHENMIIILCLGALYGIVVYTGELLQVYYAVITQKTLVAMIFSNSIYCRCHSSKCGDQWSLLQHRNNNSMLFRKNEQNKRHYWDSNPG
jgi:hypothetical protein